MLYKKNDIVLHRNGNIYIIKEVNITNKKNMVYILSEHFKDKYNLVAFYESQENFVIIQGWLKDLYEL